ncbi:MAG TPA: tRNA pseudouridine(38-40) synthase TruA [Anaeromyxobacter sp.]|nr:tRNA pseudouridine(38-40) synthase TruA [Anaeromyxobacter sp.]
MERRFYAIEIAYDGTRFRGFQRQPGLPTVQDAVEAALASVGVRAPLAVAARTDAGVHALGQVVSFAARVALDPDALRRALNAALPDGILARAVHRVGRSFHARNSAVGRTYVYLVGAPPPEALAPYAWTLPDPRAFPGVARATLDAEAVRAALGHAVGTHDFTGFARPGEQRGAVRTLLRAEVVSASWAPLHAIVLDGRGFLRAMVRNLVGTAVAAGLGVAPAAVVRELLAARGRYRGVRAPGWGLTLAAVHYPPGALDPEGRGG